MQGFFSPERRKKETLKKSTPGGNAVNKPFQAVQREKLQKNLIKSMPEKNPVLHASLGEKGRKKKSKNSAVSRKSRKGKFLQVSLLKKMQSGCAKGHQRSEKPGMTGGSKV